MVNQITQLDPDAVNLAKAIRQTESGGDFKARGKSGEYGAYQFTEPTWNTYAQKHGVKAPLQQATPEQQNEVAYKQIKEWKDGGYNPGQIASMWNSGKPDAYLDPTYKGVNKQGAKFDVPTYAKSVATAYHTIKQGGQVNADPKNPSSIANTDKPVENKSFLTKAAEFAFPILEKKERTPLQTVGDLGLSALWFLPGVGQAGAVARGAKAVKGLSEIAKSSAIAKGAGIGYGADVASGLSEGESLGEAVKPGLGTVLGAGTGGLASKLAKDYSQKGVLDFMARENNAVFAQTKSGAQRLEKSFSKNKNPGELASKKGINIKQLVDPETVSYATKNKADEIFDEAVKMNTKLTKDLGSLTETKAIKALEKQLLSSVPKNHPEQANLIKREMALFKQQYGNKVNASSINEWKQRAWDKGRFDLAVPSETRNTFRNIGHYLKKEVEMLAKKGGIKNVEKINESIGSHFDLSDTLAKLHGTKAKGGRLGNLLQDQTLQVLGGVGGLATGGLPHGLLGVLGANLASKGATSVKRVFEGSPIKSAILKKATQKKGLIKPKEALNKTSKKIQGLVTTLASRLGAQ